MKTRKIPLRKCVVTQEHHPKKELIRVVKNSTGEVFVDPSGKQNGRGAYLKKSRVVIEKARKNKILEKHLEILIPERLYDDLLSHLDDE